MSADHPRRIRIENGGNFVQARKILVHLLRRVIRHDKECQEKGTAVEKLVRVGIGILEIFHHFFEKLRVVRPKRVADFLNFVELFLLPGVRVRRGVERRGQLFAVAPLQQMRQIPLFLADRRVHERLTVRRQFRAAVSENRLGKTLRLNRFEVGECREFKLDVQPRRRKDFVRKGNLARLHKRIKFRGVFLRLWRARSCRSLRQQTVGRHQGKSQRHQAQPKGRRPIHFFHFMILCKKTNN